MKNYKKKPKSILSLKKLVRYLFFSFIPILLIYCVFEFIFFKYFLTSLMPYQQQRIAEPIQMLCELSKKSIKPHDYILILGDSYADGWGDWGLSNDVKKNLPYGTHDLMYEMTGIDTLECGFAGASVLESLIRKPINRYRYLRKTWFYKIEDPKHVLFFFYEANDLRDNINRITRDKLFEEPLDLHRIYERKKYFRWYLDTIVPKSDALYYDVRKFRWHYNLVSFHLFMDIAERLFQKYPKTPPPPIPLAKPGSNVLMIHGQKTRLLRGDLASVPVLDEEELKLSLYITGGCFDVIKDFFPRTKFTVVYIPSPITAYSIISDTVTVRKDNVKGCTVDRTQKVFERSDRMFESIKKLAGEKGMSIIDARPYLRKAAEKKGFLHGPIDWHHFNKTGYEILAKTIVNEMDFTNFPHFRYSPLKETDTVNNPFE